MSISAPVELFSCRTTFAVWKLKTESAGWYSTHLVAGAGVGHRDRRIAQRAVIGVARLTARIRGTEPDCQPRT